MVLPAPPADDQPHPSLVAPWVERIAKLLRIMERGALLLVDQANDAELGALVRALCAEHPDLLVVTEASRIEAAPHGSVIVLATRVQDALWLNLARPLFTERALRVVLWSEARTTAELARRAPDFFDWIHRRMECPPGPPAFAVAGIRAALRARAWAVAFRGKDIEAAFKVALPKRSLLRVDAALRDATLIESIKKAGPNWVVWSNVLGPQGAARARELVIAAGRRGRNVLDNPQGDAPDAWPVSDITANLAEATSAFESAGASSAAGRLAALLDLEPEAIALAIELLQDGVAIGAIQKAILDAADPGVAVGKLVGERGELDPVLVASYRAPAPLLRAFAADPRVRKASAILAGGAGPALPPLTEKIALGAAGAEEFRRLMMQLLAIYVGSSRLVRAGGEHGRGIDVIAPDGIPALPGVVAFTFHWPGAESSDIGDAVWQASKQENLTHWVWVTPLDTDSSDRQWLHGVLARRDLKKYAWGQTWIEPLLRKCPALLARYYPEEARAYLPGYDGTDFGLLATRYREKVVIFHNRLKTIGIPPEARPRESRIELPLAELFIPLRLVPEGPSPAAIELQSALAKGGSAVVLADPGMGKSTLLAYLALVFAGGVALPGVDAPPRLIPLFISLRSFVRRQKQRPGLAFLDDLHIEARERFTLPSAHPAFFESALRMGEAVVLLDGLDEVGNESARHAIAASIRTFHAEYPHCRLWVTSRIHGYTDNVRLPSSFAHYRIEPLDDAQIDDFVGRWYAHQISASPQEAREQADSLRAAVRRTPSVRRLAGNPLLLTLMAFIHHGQRRLPRDRGELYEKCIEMLLKTWQDAKRGDGEAARGLEGLTLDVSTQKDYLAHLAFFGQQKNQGGESEEARGLLSRSDVLDALTARHLTLARRARPALSEIAARDEMGRFLDYVCDETGLLLDRGNEQISFIHLSFQEYLAAWVFVSDDQTLHGPAFFVEHIGDPAWEEVLLLRLYIVLHNGGGVARFDEIIVAVLRSLERTSAPAGWLMLARAIRDDLAFRERDRGEILGRALGFWLEAPLFEGAWYFALDEVRLFAEQARGILRGVIAEARVHARKPAEVIALLHLETKLFAFPEGAAEALRPRADLGEMLADLVSFVDEPSIRALLAERATVEDWSRALRALDGPATYRMTVRWMKGPPAPAAADAATALLWEKIVGELRSRAAYAEKYRGYPEGAAIFSRPGALVVRDGKSSVTLPWASFRSLPVALPNLVPCPEARLLCQRLAETRNEEATIAETWTELVHWTERWIDSMRGRSPATTSSAQRDFGDFSVRAVRDFVRDFVRDLGRDFVRDFVRYLVRDFVRDFVRIFVRDFGRYFGNYLGNYFGSDFGRYFNNFVPVVDFDSSTKVTQIEATLKEPGAARALLAAIWWAAASILTLASFRHAAVHLSAFEFEDTALEWLQRNPVDIYATAFAWKEHCEALTNVSTSTAPLILAHAAYASLITGLECELPFTPDSADSRVRVSLLLRELCNFREPDSNVRSLNQEIASPTPGVRPLLEAAGLLAVTAPSHLSAVMPSSPSAPSPDRTPKPEIPVLFSWLHLSDIHVGHKDISHRWDQKLVLDALHRDIAAHAKHAIPPPGALLVTGDIAFSGKAEHYAQAQAWLESIASTLAIPRERIFLVPGNHDIDREVDRKSRNAARLIRGLHEGEDKLDDALANPDDRALLTSRLAAYLDLASKYPALQSPDPLFWSHAFTTPSGLALRLIGLSTPLLSAGDIDKGKLRLGNKALADTVTNADRERELVIVLTHHPLRGGWLADQRDADRWLQSRAHLHLFGHVHEAESEESRSGSGVSLIRVAAGAAHGDLLPPNVPPTHGYNVAAVVAAADGTTRLRIWPRIWSDQNKDFRADVHNLPEGSPFAEHALAGLRSPASRIP